VTVICAETTEKAKRIARSTAIWSAFNDTLQFDQIPSYEKSETYKGTNEIEGKIKKIMNRMVVGNPQEVSKKLTELTEIYQMEELILVMNTCNYKERLKSFYHLTKETIL